MDHNDQNNLQRLNEQGNETTNFNKNSNNEARARTPTAVESRNSSMNTAKNNDAIFKEREEDDSTVESNNCAAYSTTQSRLIATGGESSEMDASDGGGKSEINTISFETNVKKIDMYPMQIDRKDNVTSDHDIITAPLEFHTRLVEHVSKAPCISSTSDLSTQNLKDVQASKPLPLAPLETKGIGVKQSQNLYFKDPECVPRVYTAGVEFGHDEFNRQLDFSDAEAAFQQPKGMKTENVLDDMQGKARTKELNTEQSYPNPQCSFGIYSTTTKPSPANQFRNNVNECNTHLPDDRFKQTCDHVTAGASDINDCQIQSAPDPSFELDRCKDGIGQHDGQQGRHERIEDKAHCSSHQENRGLSEESKKEEESIFLNGDQNEAKRRQAGDADTEEVNYHIEPGTPSEGVDTKEVNCPVEPSTTFEDDDTKEVNYHIEPGTPSDTKEVNCPVEPSTPCEGVDTKEVNYHIKPGTPSVGDDTKEVNCLVEPCTPCEVVDTKEVNYPTEPGTPSEGVETKEVNCPVESNTPSEGVDTKKVNYHIEPGTPCEGIDTKEVNFPLEPRTPFGGADNEEVNFSVQPGTLSGSAVTDEVNMPVQLRTPEEINYPEQSCTPSGSADTEEVSYPEQPCTPSGSANTEEVDYPEQPCTPSGDAYTEKAKWPIQPLSTSPLLTVSDCSSSTDRRNNKGTTLDTALAGPVRQQQESDYASADAQTEAVISHSQPRTPHFSATSGGNIIPCIVRIDQVVQLTTANCTESSYPIRRGRGERYYGVPPIHACISLHDTIHDIHERALMSDGHTISNIHFSFCLVCVQQPVEVVLSCGHTLTCRECARHLPHGCPLCEAPVQYFISLCH